MNIRTFGLTRLPVALLLAAAVITFSALRSGPPRVAAATTQSASNSCGGMGTYGYTGFGNTFEGNGAFPAGIFSSNGTITVDRSGHLSIHEVEMVNGQVVSPPGGATFEGTLTINPDCTATGTLDGIPGTALVGVVVDNGKQIRALLTVPGVQVNFVSTVRVNP